jgi:hypothetical protein
MLDRDIATFDPAKFVQALQKSVRWVKTEAVLPPKSRWSGFAGCWARVVSGATAAPPGRVMNSRRFVPDLRLPPALALRRSVHRMLSLPQSGQEADL